MELDLDLNNYELNDIYHLFHIKVLNEDSMREAKKIVLKTHPDKSKLDSSIFLFYSKAYKRLYEIYEFQNKSSHKKQVDNKDYKYLDNAHILETKFGNDTKQFNRWFNDQFVKYHGEADLDESNKGYGDWMKSDDGVYDGKPVSKNEMNAVFAREKRRVQQLTVYKGVQDYTTEEYTDLKQAYVESVIPVTDDDYNQKYHSLEDLKRSRVSEQPLDKEVSNNMLRDNNKRLEEDSAALAFKYAKQLEESKKNNALVWSTLKQLELK
jgi:hypothetical protein